MVAVPDGLKVYVPVLLTPQSSKETLEDHLLKTTARSLLIVSEKLIEARVLGSGVDIIVPRRNFRNFLVEQW